MKYVVFILALCVVLPAQAAIDPDLAICDRYGFELVETTFDDGNVFRQCKRPDGVLCSVERVYEGFCGDQELSFLSCVEEGGTVFPEFESCCADAVPYMKRGQVGQPFCKKINKVQEVVGDIADSSIAMAILVAALAGAIPAYIIRRKRTL